jgi:hypothetical protein
MTNRLNVAASERSEDFIYTTEEDPVERKMYESRICEILLKHTHKDFVI